MGKRFILLVFVYCLSILSYSQSSNPPYSTLQRVIPPSPEAISIAKVGFSDVNLYAGKASYSLPIYTISQNGISFPISLSYTGGGGIKVEELGSSVGLGWNLSSTGTVTRAIRGVADDTYAGNYIGYLHLPDFPPMDTSAATIQTYTHYAHNRYDAQPDLFSLSVAGVSAQFYINKNKKVVFLEKSDIKITPIFSGYSIIAFEAKDTYGRTYYFSELEKSKSEPVDDTYAEYEDYNTTSWFLKKITSEYGKDIITFTYLSGESNQIKHDVQSPYQYREPNGVGFYTDNTSFSHLFIKRPILQKISFATGEVNFTMSDSSRYDINGDEYIKSIVVKNYLGETIKNLQFFSSYFSTTGTIQQGQGSHQYYGNSALRLKLDSLQDVSRTNQKLTYKFIYETSHYLPDRMGSFQVDHWGFYNGAAGNTGWEPNYRLKYYFQQWPMSDPVAHYVENRTANREPNLEYAKSGVLKEVVMPTGGKVRFDYELNTSSDLRLPNIVYDTSFFPSVNYTPNYFQVSLIREPFAYVSITSSIDNSSYSYEYILCDSANAGNCLITDTLVYGNDNHEYKVEPGTYFVKVRVLGAHPDPGYQYFARVFYEKERLVLNKKIGGLRIRAMHLIDSVMGTDIVRNYYYNESGDTSSISPSTGEIAREPKYGLQYMVMWSSDYTPNYFSAEFIIPQGYMRQLTSVYPLGVTSGNTVGYRKVTTVDSNKLRTEHYFTSYKDFPELADGYIDARLSDDDSRVIEGTSYEVMPYAPEDERDFLRGKLKKQIEFRKENGVFQKIHQTENIYGFNMGYEINKHTHMLPDTLEYLTGMLFNIEGYSEEGGSPLYSFKKYSLYTTKHDLVRTVDKQYSYQGGSIDSLVTQSDIYYGDSPWYIDSLYHYQPTKITKFTNSGSEVSKIYYPYHWRYDVPFADAAEEAKMQTLEAANRIAVPVLQIVEDSATNYHVSSVKNTYSTFVSGKLAVNYIKTKIGSASTFEDNISFNRYDTLGNLIEQQKVNDIKSTYLWDHKNSFPIAEITNADSASVAYSSFEADGKGNWTYSGSNVDTIAITGKKAYKLTGANNITKTGLSSGTVYFVSYWTRNSSAFTITGTQSGYPIAGRTVNGWKYFEHKITGQTTVTISGTGWIDELRLYPSNALMSTLTYIPLVGISSQCDANNRISYYEYDAFNRLTMIRDQDNNIIKRICYNYAGQVEECYVPPAAAPSTVSIQSNNYSAMSGYTAVYTNVSTSQQTSFSIPSAGGLQTLGQLTPGTYNLTISKTGFQPTMIFGAGCNGYTISGTSATFYNIVITSTNCKTVSIEMAE